MLQLAARSLLQALMGAPRRHASARAVCGGPRLARLLPLLLALVPEGAVAAPYSKPRQLTAGYWQEVAGSGVVNASHLAVVNCEGIHGGVWDSFRALFQDHIESGLWNFADESAWVTHKKTWPLVKAAEEIIEIWKHYDMGIAPGPEDVNLMARESPATPFQKADRRLVDTMAIAHLERVSRPPDHKPPFESFASSCMLGLVAAIVTFGRALAILGKNKPADYDPSNDGFSLWRVEIGWILSALMSGEGTLLADLTTAPGWPGVDVHFVEQVLHFGPEQKEPDGSPSPYVVDKDSHGIDTVGSLRFEDGHLVALAYDPDTSKERRLAYLGSPRMNPEPRPTRMPPAERLRRATDPMGSTGWGQRAAMMLEELAGKRWEFIHGGGWHPGMRHPWHQWAPNWVPPPTKLQEEQLLPPSPLRYLALISQHGALDLEVPELLAHLFPSVVRPRYVLYGEDEQLICEKTEGSSALKHLCPADTRHEDANIPKKKPPPPAIEWQHRLFDRRWLLEPTDPRLYFPGAEGGGPRRPELISTCSWIEAIWASRFFPDVPLVLFFGPPVFIIIAGDLRQGRQDVVDDFWRGFGELMDRTRAGSMLVAGESLFRTEQFFYQTGIEVPFLRPMSVWVNATRVPRTWHRPPIDGGRPSQVLVHSRGRLRFEVHFILMLQLLKGSAANLDLISQEGRVIPFRELADFDAVVILPWSPEICFLRHLFRMHVPAVVPARSLLRNLVHISNQRLLPYPYNTPHPQSDREQMRQIHPWDPFLDTARPAGDPRGVAARSYWAEYSEYLLLPGLAYFSSAADLLRVLHEMEGSKLSAQMRASWQSDLQEMKSFWAETLHTLLKSR